MSDPADYFLQWYDGRIGERSDEQVIAENKRFELVEQRTAPLNMTASEILGWIEEMRPVIQWQKADEYVIDGVYVTIPEMGRTFGKSLHDAICLAAAKWEEANE